MKTSLERIIDDIPFDNLPANWNSFDLSSFSKQKKLWDYQQRSVVNSLKVLWKYYEDSADYSPNERNETNRERKRNFNQLYRGNGQDEDLDIQLKNSRNILNLLGDYYPVSDEGKISYEHFLNRACFWMATGSGKTLVIIKLIELLQELIKRSEIPGNDILVLTHRDDLIEHLKDHLREFNACNSGLFINLRELREYSEAKRDNPSLFRGREITVFYYRSDNLSNEQKDKIIDFRNYDNNGCWYLLLDEAHKGDKEDSKRQHIYSILSRNGFLFNFSATFTDLRDLVTTASNFNLTEFIRAGYGKHLEILEQETRAFRDEEDYSNEEKQKIVLKSLILTAYAKKAAGLVREVEPGMYHNPLLLTLVNSVNTQDADLKLFFRELERIGRGQITEKLWKSAKGELWYELKLRPSFMFEDVQFEVDEKTFESLSRNDVMELVYNGSKHSDIEILVRPSNRQEIALKLKTSDRPFALIKIGDISGWLKDELSGYEINESFEDEGYFQRLNEDDSDINILMGSRSFYEGWDSNRPNVINFINIGTGTEAKKFILQAVGRGVRIEPLKNKRKRLLPLHNAKEVSSELFDGIKDKVAPLETLFIIGTDRQALKTVIEHLSKTSKKEDSQQLSLFLNDKAGEHTLLIPVYKVADQPLADSRKQIKFPVADDELQIMQNYAKFIDDDRVMLAIHDADPAKLRVLRESLNKPDDFYRSADRLYKNTELLVGRVLDYFGIVPKDFEKFKELSDEIRHFRNISVTLKDISELEEKVESLAKYENPEKLEALLEAKWEAGEISRAEYKEGIKKSAKMVREATVQYDSKRLMIRHLANHYYIPMILSGENERISFIKHIIQERSEIDFINKLEEYLGRADNLFKKFDWWFFSKLDESMDEVYIPYYNPKLNRIAPFNPDFIFWMRRGKEYFILFIDPKGTAYADYQHKIDWYKELFETGDGSPRKIKFGNLSANVFAFLYTQDENSVSKAYRPYWFDNMENVLKRVIQKI
jgi:superfamily II DNA or RNA helicase